MCEGHAEGGEVGQLAADMDRNGRGHDARQAACEFIDLGGASDIDPELVFLATGRNLVVCIGIHIRVHPDCNVHLGAHLMGDFGQCLQFWYGFYVELADPGADGLAHLGAGLADAGEDDVFRRDPYSQGAFQFPTRDHVRAGAQRGQGAQNGDVGVRLHRVAHARVQPFGGERTGETGVGVAQRSRGIDIDGSAHRVRDLGQRDTLGVQFAVAVVEIAHLRLDPAQRVG